MRLVKDAPDGFRAIGPLSWGGDLATGARAARVAAQRRGGGELPALFVLPGILGSHLKAGGDRVWLGWRLVNGFDRLAYDAGKNDGVADDGPIGLFYDDLAMFLSRTTTSSRSPSTGGVRLRRPRISWPTPSRRPSTRARVRQAGSAARALDGRDRCADDAAGTSDTWDRMMKVTGARILMLGTPNDGSWAPMQVLSGDDTFGNMLTVVGAPFRGYETRQLIAQFPGCCNSRPACSTASASKRGGRRSPTAISRRSRRTVSGTGCRCS